MWYAFWGEASSRQEYYDICGQKDESFAALVRELIGRLIDDTSQPQLDPDGIALGLIGVLEMLWQDFAFQTEGNIDRQAAKRRCMAYLRSIFPGQFSLRPPGRLESRPAAGARPFAAGRTAMRGPSRMERERLFQSAWQIAGRTNRRWRSRATFCAADTGSERAAARARCLGNVHALRNSCPELPHALVSEAGADDSTASSNARSMG